MGAVYHTLELLHSSVKDFLPAAAPQNGGAPPLRPRSPGQKIAYLDGGLYWLANCQKMIFILAPLLFLLTGITTIVCRPKVLLAIFLPHVMADYFAFSALAPKTRNIRWAHYYETIMAPYLSLSVIKELLHLKIGFHVTSKDTTIDHLSFQGLVVLPHILLCCLTVLAWGHALHRLVSGRAYLDSFVLNFLWSFFNMTGLTTAIRVAWQKPIRRKTERIRIKSPVACRLRYGGKEVPVHLKDLSGCGAGVTAEDALALHAGQKVYLDFDEVRLRCCVVRNNGHELGLEFLNLAPASMKYVMSLFCENLESYYKFSEQAEPCAPRCPEASRGLPVLPGV